MEKITAIESNGLFIGNKIIKADFVDMGNDSWRWIFILENGNVISLPVYPSCPIHVGTVTDKEFLDGLETASKRASEKAEDVKSKIQNLIGQ